MIEFLNDTQLDVLVDLDPETKQPIYEKWDFKAGQQVKAEVDKNGGIVDLYFPEKMAVAPNVNPALFKVV